MLDAADAPAPIGTVCALPDACSLPRSLLDQVSPAYPTSLVAVSWSCYDIEAVACLDSPVMPAV